MSENSFMLHEEPANLIYTKQRAIAEAVVALQFKRHPEMEPHYGANGRAKRLLEMEYYCLHLAEAVRFDEDALFLDHVAWAKVLLFSMGVKEAELLDNLEMLLQAAREVLPQAFHETVSHYIQSAIHQLPQMANTVEPFVQIAAPHGELANDYMNYLLARDGKAAGNLIWKTVEAGTPIADIYHDVFVPCLREVGRLWQTHQVNEAFEHYCTETTHTLLAVLSHHLNPSGSRRTALGFCVANERHLLGIRMVLDYFQLHGWNTVCLGGDVPGDNVEEVLQTWLPDVVLVSATMIYHLAEVRSVISAIRAASLSSKPIVLAGGRPFEISPELWRKVGADLPSGSCSEVIRVTQTI
jgi:MerR family transcriptional regulator, light-induced transcriptional regulator